MSLPEILERAASQLPNIAERIRPANGDPDQLLEDLAASEAAEMLVWVLGQDAHAAAELVDAWGEWEKGAEVLLGVSDADLVAKGVEKSARKILRKAHHRLRSRGIEVAASTPPPVSRRPIAAVEDAFEAASLSAPDFRGARVGYLASPHPGGGARLFEIRFDEGRGILDFKVYNAGRSKVRGFLRNLSKAQSQTLFDVSRDALCALVRRASHAQPDDRPLPSGFVEWRGRLFSEELESQPTPGGETRAAIEASGAAVGSSQVEDAVSQVVELVAEGAVGPWPPATSWVSAWMDKGRESVEGLSGAEREAAIDAWNAEVAQDLVAQGDRELLARHLEELAWVRQRTDGESEAANLIATADVLRSDAEVERRLAAARVDSLFAPFLGELRVDPTTIDDASQAVAGE